MQFDATGKITLDHIYTQPDPRDFARTLRPLDYRIPQLAKPYFAKFLDEYRATRRVPVPTVVDVGSSYGVNAALLRADATLDEFYARYTGDADQLDRERLLARDRDWLRARGDRCEARFIGLDTAGPALDYALAAGYLDAAVHADFESREPDARQRDVLRGADLVISTGCLGYVGERTLHRVVDAAGPRRPWMAHFVLRMFPFDAIAAGLAELGYRTTRVDGVFEQRRFANPQEQQQMLATLTAAGVDPTGLEADGRLYAELHLSRPHD
ncbi:class I SAM-dependent methyltransferase [Saccharopolyspora sp. NPDC047091]|uniref:class I SAM-dependent methyltransferase n=1 Tax=Saccharopolyspora sp. NPDC047091 TaxID=3155924 RepID=UPI0033D76096